jgi:tol-pal system protein YbgF
MRHLSAFLLCLLLASPGPSAAQQQETLADIRQQLTILYVELRKLKQELNTTGATGNAVSGTSALDRVGAMESELQRLTAKAEELEFRIDRIVRDGTNQIGDLEFRLCELEANCDVSKLGDTPTLGGGEVPQVTMGTATVEDAGQGPELAVGERADFDRAQAALESGNYQAAADQFATFNQTYPGGPLAAAADIGRGEALEGLGDTREAARAYLSAFSTNQLGPEAPEALVRLGAALGKLGQTAEACVTLSEVSVRYPQATDAQQQATAEMQALGCS